MFGPGDIDSGIPVSVTGETALLTTKLSLALTVRLLTMSTLVACSRGIPGVNRMQRDTSKHSLVGEEETELPE